MNAFGLHDMLGNLWEWGQDCWNESYSGAPTDGSAWTSGDCSRRVLRGGSWNNNPRNVCSANRNRNRTTNRNNNIGFRISRTPYAGTEVSKDLSGVPGRVRGRS